MFDIGWGEFVVIGAVALVVIGPKELPGVLRSVGGAVSKLKRMAGEFQQQFNDAIRESEFEEARKAFDGANNTISSASTFNPIQTIREEIKNAVEGSGTNTAAAGTTPPETTPSALPASEVQATAPPPIIDIPPPPPVPDLTPEQIQAAFVTEPAPATAAGETLGVEEAPAPRKRRSRKTEEAEIAVAEASAEPAAPATSTPEVDAGVDAEPEKPKRRARKAKATDDGESAG